MSPDADATDPRTRTAPPQDADTVSAASTPTGEVTPSPSQEFERLAGSGAASTPTGEVTPRTKAPTGGTARVPGYEILGELGRGGMGVVFKALHLSLGRPVALKMMLGESDDASPAALRFLAEAAAVAAVTHPHVVGVYDYGRAAGMPYLALELCGKGTLGQRLKAAGRFDPRTAAEVVAKIAEGVGAAHAAGVVHRDLKPGNVLFDDKNEPKVTDFGLAKRGTGSDLTQTNAVMGTPAYMSPEQAKGDTKFVGPPADVWALGVMLYECLTGRRPFTAPDQMGMLHQVMYADPPTVRSIVKSLPPDLDQVVRKCLSKAPHERYVTAGELAADLRNWLDGRPVSARPPGPLTRAVKWVRRNPLPTALIASLATVVVAVAGGAYFSIQQLERANQAQADKLTAEEEKRKVEEARRSADEQKRVTAFQSSMRLALQRGAANEAVVVFERLTADNLSPPEEMKLDRAKASYFLGETEDAGRWLKEVDGGQLPEARRGEAELLRGLLLLGPNDDAGLAAISGARELGLSDADDHFAAGMLAGSTAEALNRFRLAFVADPAHIDARVMAAVALTLLARYDEASAVIEQTRPLAPDHPFVPLLGVIVAGMSGDKQKTSELLDDYGRRVRDPKLKEALPVVADLFGVLPELRTNFQAVLAGDQAAYIGLVMRLGPNTPNVKKVQAVIDAGLFPRSMSVGLPPCFRADLTLFVSECVYDKGGNHLLAGVFKRWLPGLDTSKSVFAFTDKTGQEEAKRVLARFPEGTLKGLYAGQLFELAVEASAKAGNRPNAEQWDEAAAALEEAARTPGHIVPTGFMLEHAAWVQFVATRADSNDPANAKRFATVRRLIEERLKMDAPFTPIDNLRRLTMAAAGSGDYELARVCLVRWEKALPRPNKDYLLQRAMLEMKQEAYKPALRCLDQIPLKGLTAADAVTVQLMRDKCRQELKLPELLPPPRKAD